MTLQGASQASTGERVFFSGANRSLMLEDEIRLTSVGVDIGSSTAHLLFSEITLERLDTRYSVTERKEIHASRIPLTPCCDDGSNDAEALGRFVEQQYAEAGRFVAVSAGDGVETIMAAQGLGALATSQTGDVLDSDRIVLAVGQGLTQLDLADGARPVALSIRWRGSASYYRLCALGQGLIAGLGPVLNQGHPLIVVSDRDIDGLLGMPLPRKRRADQSDCLNRRDRSGRVRLHRHRGGAYRNRRGPGGVKVAYLSVRNP
jgi:ethanolamine utilization protein EutA (predicted chaperonin)